MTALLLAGAAVAALLTAVLGAGLDGALGKALVVAATALLAYPTLKCWARRPTRPGLRAATTTADMRS